MRWLYSPLRHCVSPRDAGFSRSRLFIYLGLTAIFLLLAYQIVLDQALDVDASWKSIQGIIVVDDEDESAPDAFIPAEKELVLAAMQASNMSWVEEHLPDWRANIYRADAEHNDKALTVPVNKGNEAMVYLTCVFQYFLFRYQNCLHTDYFCNQLHY